jgi:hypothetical protein
MWCREPDIIGMTADGLLRLQERREVRFIQDASGNARSGHRHLLWRSKGAGHGAAGIKLRCEGCYAAKLDPTDFPARLQIVGF